MKRQELYQQAKREVAHRRQRAEVEALRLRKETYKKHPQLQLLELEKSAAGAAAARLAADGLEAESKAKLAEMHELAGQYRALMRAQGLSLDALEPRYQCTLCGDTGETPDGPCECVKQEVRRLRRREINENGPLTLCSFDSFKLDMYPERLEGVNVSPRTLMGLVLEDCKTYAAQFGPGSPSLYFYGDAGLGKTHLALSVAGQVLEQGFDVIYVSAQTVFSQLAQERREWTQGELLPSMLEADLLVLDDLGSEFIDAFTLSRLYEIVNTRMYRRPTIYTSNITREDQMYQRYTEKIASRLLGECKRIRFAGQDIRLQENRYRLD